MKQFIFSCPQCGVDIEAEDSFSGQVVECPSCGKGIVVPQTPTGLNSSLVHQRVNPDSTMRAATRKPIVLISIVAISCILIGAVYTIGIMSKNKDSLYDKLRQHNEQLQQNNEQLQQSNEQLQQNNEQLRNCIVHLSSVIELEDAVPPFGLMAEIDVAPREARELEDPDMVNLLEDYHPEYEMTDLKLMKWGLAETAQLSNPYSLDAEGNKKFDSVGKPVTCGPGTAQELIDRISERAMKQYEKLAKTRLELANMRGKLQSLADKYNKLVKEVRLCKIELKKKELEIIKLKTE